jgi:hypothetical protein
MLSGAPLSELDELTAPVSVRFQAGDESAVDDMLVRGIRADGVERVVAVAGRRDPKIVPSSPDSRKLIESYVRALREHFEEARDGTWRLGLAAAVTSKHAAELSELSSAARLHSDSGSFKTSLPNRKLRDRLAQLERLIDELPGDLLPATELNSPTDRAWWLLRALHVRLLRLEGGEQSDWTVAVRLLIPLTRSGTADEAATVMSQIANLVDDYAPAGAFVDEKKLRADLGGLLPEDVWVDGFSRRVTRDPETIRYLGMINSKLMAIRLVARRSLGLSETQVDRSFLAEPVLPQALSNLAPGEVVVLSGPIGSGKTDIALRWLLNGRPDGVNAWGCPIPVFLRAEHLQNTIEIGVRDESGLSDAPDRFGVDLVIDGLDERPGASPITLAQEFVRTHPKCRVVITAREGELIPSHVSVLRTEELSLDEVRGLVGAILECEPWQVGRHWTPEFFEAARRPLFALLAAAHSEDARGTGASLIDLAVRDALSRVPVRAGLEELALATIRAGRAVDPHTVGGLSAEAVRSSPLLESDGPRVRFVLPIFEQWFAAQAVLEGSVDTSEFSADERGFARWRYVLAIALSGGTWEANFPWLDRLVRTNPAAGAWVVREAVRTDLRSTSTSTSTSTASGLEHAVGIPEQIWDAMAAWAEGLGWASPYLGPGSTLGVIAPGTLDGVRLAVGLAPEGHITVAWLPRKSGSQLPVEEHLPPDASLREGPGIIISELAPDSEIWAWNHTLRHMNRKALETLLTDGRFLAQSCVSCGVVRAEFDWWLTAHTLGFNDIWPAHLTNELIIKRTTEMLGKLVSSGEKHITVRQYVISKEWLERLKSRAETDGDHGILDPWPIPDLDVPVGGAVAYSDDRALERANAVYAGAARAYEEIRLSLFPSFGKLLGHAATFPAVLEGRFESRADGTMGGDLGSASIDYWLRPIRDGLQDVPVRAALQWGRDKPAWSEHNREEAFAAFARRRRDDPVGSAFELTSVQTSVVHNEFWGRRPATHLAVGWLLEDLASLGWIDSRPAWVHLK